MLTTRARGAHTRNAACSGSPNRPSRTTSTGPAAASSRSASSSSLSSERRSDDSVRAQGEHVLEGCAVAADADHAAGPVLAGQLDGELADRAGGPEDQHRLPAPQPGVLDEGHERRGSGVPDGRRQYRVNAVGQRQQVLVVDEYLGGEGTRARR